LTYLNLSSSQVASGTVLAGLVMLALAPRVAVLIARIRPPDLPDPGDEVSPATLNDIFDAESGGGNEPDLDIETRARLAVTSLIGLIVAVSIVMPIAMVIAAKAHPGGVREIVMAAAVTGILVLRSRSYPDRVQATALLASAVATLTGVGYVLVLAYQSPVSRLAVAVIVAAAVLSGCVASALLPGVRLSPVTRRVIDMIEYTLIIVVPILAS
jgi:type VII secretion integral membrane protein EccD